MSETIQDKAVELLKTPIRKEWLNPKEVDAEYGLFISTLAKWRMKNKNLPFSKVGKAVKYKRSDIEAFLNANVVAVQEVA